MGKIGDTFAKTNGYVFNFWWKEMRKRVERLSSFRFSFFWP